MIQVTGFDSSINPATVRANANLGDQVVFIEYDRLTGVVVDSTFKETSDLFKSMDKQARAILVFKVMVDLTSADYTVREYNQLQDWHDRLVQAEKVLTEMDRLVTSEDWLSNQLGQTTGSVIDAINEVRIALDSRLSNC